MKNIVCRIWNLIVCKLRVQLLFKTFSHRNISNIYADINLRSNLKSKANEIDDEAEMSILTWLKIDNAMEIDEDSGNQEANSSEVYFNMDINNDTELLPRGWLDGSHGSLIFIPSGSSKLLHSEQSSSIIMYEISDTTVRDKSDHRNVFESKKSTLMLR